MAKKTTACPCGGTDYDACCGRYHEGMPAPDAVSLMRSRYSAYVLKLESYLLDTWHPDTRPEKLDFDDRAKWLGLEICDCSNPSMVEFVARFKINGRAHRLHENSQFVFEEGRWLYLDGKFLA